MPKKQNVKETAELSIEETGVILKPVKVVVTRKHCLLPHSIELRKNRNGIVIGARTEDWRHVQTIGATTIEEIFRETGHEIPAAPEAEFEINISPFTGEIVAIRPKTKEIPAEASERENVM